MPGRDELRSGYDLVKVPLVDQTVLE